VLAELFTRRVDLGICAKRIGIKSALAEDVGRAYDGVLRVRSGLAFKTERIFEIECNYGGLGVLQHEVAQRADGDLGGNCASFVIGELWVTRINFALGGGDETIDQIIGLYPETFAARNIDLALRFFFFRQFVAKFGSTARR